MLNFFYLNRIMLDRLTTDARNLQKILKSREEREQRIKKAKEELNKFEIKNLKK